MFKVLATLSFMASGSYQRKIGQDFLSCMCQSSMSKVLHQVVEGLNQIMEEWIKFPTQQHEIQHIKEQFVIYLFTINIYFDRSLIFISVAF